MKEAERKICDQLVEVGRWMAEEDLAWGSSGNLSARVGDNFLLSATGTWLGELSQQDFALCRIADGAALAGAKPSKELPMHRAIYRARPQASWVLHSSPLWTTLFACQHRRPVDGLFIEAMNYLGDVAEADYCHPGTQALGDAVEEAARGASIVLLRNHGVIVAAESLREARMKLVTFEFACRLQATAASSGGGLRPLHRDTVEEFRSKRFYRPNA